MKFFVNFNQLQKIQTMFGTDFYRVLSRNESPTDDAQK